MRPFAAVAILLLLAGCGQPEDGMEPLADGWQMGDPEWDDTGERASSASGSASSPSTGQAEDIDSAIVVRFERTLWLERTSGDDRKSIQFGAHCGQASWTEDPARVIVEDMTFASWQEHGTGTELRGDVWPADAMVLTRFEVMGDADVIAHTGNAPTVTSLDATNGTVAILAAAGQRTLANLTSNSGQFAIEGQALRPGEQVSLDWSYQATHADSTFSVHERLTAWLLGPADVTARVRGPCA